jgi:iron-sulfur cluster assembly protein
MKQAITLTETAADQIRAIVAASPLEQKVLGVRLGVSSKGCSGKSYVMDYVTEANFNPADEKVQDKDVTIFIDPRAILFLIGTEMDYVDRGTSSGFEFNNPNEKARCGCGESFMV